MKSHKFMHCGWEPDESGDTYAREDERKSRLAFDPEDHVYYSMAWITGYTGHVDDLAIEP